VPTDSPTESSIVARSPGCFEELLDFFTAFAEYIDPLAHNGFSKETPRT
jgi:hypothetical protein